MGKALFGRNIFGGIREKWAEHITRIKDYFYFLFLSKVIIKDVVVFFRKKTKDEYIINEIFNLDTYMLNWLRLKEDSSVVDVGAQIGCFAVNVAKLLPKGKIFCFEPEPQNYAILKKNIKINKGKNIYCFRMAVSDQNGFVKLFYPYENKKKQTGEYGIFKVVNRHQNKHIRVKSASLDSIIKENKIEKVDLLKLDCEGAEYQILYGSSQKTLKAIDKIIMEYHLFKENDQFDLLSCYLKENGFKLLKKIPDPKFPKLGLAFFVK